MEGKKAPREKKTAQKSEDLDKIQENADHEIKYKYTSFEEMKEQGEYNFYGIIYDASFPTEESIPGVKDSTKYTCIIKLIDQTKNYLTNPNDFDDNVITLIVKSNEKENTPFIHHIGDIMRVHRALYAPKKRRNAYLHVGKDEKYKGSWVIFSGEGKSDLPLSCSNKHYTIEDQDKQVIEKTRSWIHNYLSIDKSLKYPYQKKLGERNVEGGDCDLLVHVVKKVELDEQIVLFVQDETDGCELHTYKYYNFIQENDVIRVRAYKVFDASNIILNEYGNILIVPNYSSYHKQFMNELAKKLKELQKGK